MSGLKVIWSNRAKEQLKQIYNYYKSISPRVAKKLKDEILNNVKDLVFAEQYQKDEIQPEFRRIIVKNYKLIYTIDENTIWILMIFDSRKDPDSQTR